jgi:tetratricopeptide (TPR) repeat protein
MRGLQTVLAAEADLEQGRVESALERANQLLAEYPGHLAGKTILGMALCQSGEAPSAREQFEIVLAADPENARARLGLARCLEAMGDHAQAAGQVRRALALGASDRDAALALPPEARSGRVAGEDTSARDPLARAVRLLSENRFTEALQSFDLALEATPLLPEAWLGRLQALWHLAAPGVERSAAELLSNWPSCIIARLILADLHLQSGRVQEGTELLHQAQALDPSGIVARRVLGGRRQYSHLWAGLPPADERPEPKVAKSAPPAVEAEEDRTAPTTAVEATQPARNPSLAEIKAELNRLVDYMSKDSAAGSAPSTLLRPSMLLVTNSAAIRARFDEAAATAVDQRLAALSSLLTTPDHVVHTLDVSSPASVAALGAQLPESPRDPKALQAVLDQAVKGCLRLGADPRYVLIVGGDSIIPFGRVPNPADDQDGDIYTDAPYACGNGSEMLPSVALGRIPDGEDAATLIAALDFAIEAHSTDAALDRKDSRRHRGKRTAADVGQPPSFGYTTSVWRSSSRAVFDAIGEARQLRMSPPLTHQEFETLVGARPRLAYFNLHGVEGEAPWYGQRDPEFAADYPLFPVALMPDAITPSCAKGITVFSEACYGADILARTARDSIAVKYMAAGARAFVGSTRLAYGSLTPPLACADLLGRFFWTALLNGMSSGQALQWAKLAFANDVMGRQGYLDAEDQKTLLTFNLLGDPTLTADSRSASWDAPATQAMVSKTALVTCHAGRCSSNKEPVSVEVLESVRSYVSKTLPWLAPSEVRSAPQVICSGKCTGNCGGNAVHGAGSAAHGMVNSVVTISGKAGGPQDKSMNQVVKITVDRRGSIVKMSVSR